MTKPLAATPAEAGRARRDLSLIALVYVLVHIPLLLNRGLFWDDWAFWQQDKQVVATAFRNLGSTWPPHVFYAIFYSDAGIVFGRFTTFASLFGAAVCLYLVLASLPRIPARTAVLAASAFAVYPVYQARIALVMVIYSMCLGLFAAGTLALVRSLETRRMWPRVAAVVLFVLSFRTASLLVLFAVVPVVIVAVERGRGRGWRANLRTLLGHADVLAAPFIYWVAARIFFKPGGVTYVEYNRFTDQPLETVWKWFWQGAYGSVVTALERATTEPSLTFVLAGLVVGVVLALVLLRGVATARPATAVWLLLAGVALVALAVFPYVMVEKVPDTLGWASRHQLLVPVGAALLVAGAVELLAGNGSRIRTVLAITALAAVLGVSIGSHWFSYIGWQRDWFKQQALMQAFARAPEMREGTTFIVRDEARRLDYDKFTKRRVYEYTGMAEELFGDQTRLMLAAEDYDAADHLKLRRIYNPYYKLADYDERRPQYLVIVRSGEPDLRRTAEVLRLTALDWVDRAEMRQRVDGAVQVTFEPLEWPRTSSAGQ